MNRRTVRFGLAATTAVVAATASVAVGATMWHRSDGELPVARAWETKTSHPDGLVRYIVTLDPHSMTSSSDTGVHASASNAVPGALGGDGSSLVPPDVLFSALKQVGGSNANASNTSVSVADDGTVHITGPRGTFVYDPSKHTVGVPSGVSSVPAAAPATELSATGSAPPQSALDALRDAAGVMHVLAVDATHAEVAVKPGTNVAKLPGVTKSVTEKPVAAAGLSGMPSDPYNSLDWWINNTGTNTFGQPGVASADTGVLNAWSRTRGRGVVVAVVDSGMDLSHVDLAGQVWTNPNEACNATSDTDGDGFVGDCHGWNFYRNSSDVTNGGDSEHGTGVAGTIAALLGNGQGATGIAPEAKIMPLVAGPNGSVYMSQAAAAVRYAADHGANVINLSFGGTNIDPYYQQLMVDAINYAASKNVLVVAAAGNDGGNRDTTPLYPADLRDPNTGQRLPNLISVGASDATDGRASFSAYGATNVDLFAPGVDVITPMPGGGFQRMWGTSLASPLVAGAAALAYSERPNMPVTEARQRLLDSAARKPALGGLSVTGGRLDVDALMQGIPTPVKVQFTNLDSVQGNTPRTMHVILSGNGDGLPDGPLGLKLTVASRYNGSVWAVSGATIDAGAAGSGTTSDSGDIVLHPAGLTKTALTAGLDVPVTFTLPEGTYAILATLTDTSSTPVARQQVAVFATTGAPADNPTANNTGGAGSNSGGGSSNPSNPSGGGGSTTPSNPGGGSTSPSNPSGGGSTPSNPGGTATSPSNPGGSSTSPTNPGGTATSPSNPGGGTAASPSNQGGGTATSPSNPGGGGSISPSSPGGTATGPSNPGGGTATSPSNPGGTTNPTNPGGCTTCNPVPEPTADALSISPSSGALAGGYDVTLQGSNLPTGWTVLFGDLPAQVVSESASQIVVTAPGRGGNAGSVMVSLQSPDKSQLLSLWKFTYLTAAQANPDPTSPGGGTASPSNPGGGSTTGPTSPGGGTTSPSNPGGGSTTSPTSPGGGNTSVAQQPYGGPSQGRINLGNGVSLVGVGTQLSGVTSGIWGFAQCGNACDAINI